MKNFKSVIWGLILIAVGLLLGCNAAGLTNIDIFFDGWWTLFIIVPSFINLFADEDKIGSIIGMVVGGLLLAGCQDVLDFELIGKMIVPLILVLIGVSLLFKSTINKGLNQKIKKLNESVSEEDGYAAIFSGQDIKIDNDKFKGTNISAVFGGMKLDLRNIKMKDDIVINASSIFGGTEILVPEGATVQVKSTSIFGGVTNKKQATSKDKEPIIYVNAMCLFGGVDIK